jgi:hypothetical protein
MFLLHSLIYLLTHSLARYSVMDQSIQQIELDLQEHKQALTKVEPELQKINNSIDEAEKNILNDIKVQFWESKLTALREDKGFLLRKEENLHKEILMLEKSRLAAIQLQSGEFGFFNIDDEDDEDDEDQTASGPRGRNATWQAGKIAMAMTDGNSSSTVEDSGVKGVESSPSIMTKVPEDEILNHDPNASLQGQNRRPHMGNLKKNDSITRVDSFNVFGVGVDDDDDAPVPSVPKKVVREVSESTTSETSEQGGVAGVGKFLHDFFDASESLLLAQENTPDGEQAKSKVLSGIKKTSAASDSGSSIHSLQPAVSTHDFSVFGADMYNDSDEDK